MVIKVDHFTGEVLYEAADHDSFSTCEHTAIENQSLNMSETNTRTPPMSQLLELTGSNWQHCTMRRGSIEQPLNEAFIERG